MMETVSESRGFPNLETFAISSEDGEYPCLSLDDFIHPIDPIKLHNVPQIRAVFFMGPPHCFILPWSQLHSLHLGEIDAVDAMQILFQCTNLQDLTVFRLEEEFISDIILPPQLSIN
jgi:hypothetical protein